MKKLLGLALALVGASAMANGPYDGVYQYGLSPVFYSVHQSGSTLLVASMGSLPLSGVQIGLGAGFTVVPSSIQHWTYSIGSINGNTARVTGLANFGACSTTTDVTFDGQGNAYGTFVNSVTTLFGSQQGVNCPAFFQAALAVTGPTITLHKIF